MSFYPLNSDPNNYYNFNPIVDTISDVVNVNQFMNKTQFKEFGSDGKEKLYRPSVVNRALNTVALPVVNTLIKNQELNNNANQFKNRWERSKMQRFAQNPYHNMVGNNIPYYENGGTIMSSSGIQVPIKREKLKLYEEGGDMESEPEAYSISAPTEEKPDYSGYSNETIASLNKLDALDKLDDITEYQEPVSAPEDDYYSIRKRKSESSQDDYWDARPKSNDFYDGIFDSSDVSTSINQGGFEAYKDRIEIAANRHGIKPGFLAAILDTESSFDPDVISGKKRSSAKATGIAQFIPATEKEYGIDATDPNQSIEAAAKKLAGLVKRYNGDYGTAAMAYNTGEGNIARVMKGLQPLSKETKEYMPKVLGRMNSYDKIFSN